MKTVSCPRCGAPTRYAPENKWRPFCSERCKMIDLGAWAAERHRLPVEEDKKEPGEDDRGPPSSG